MNYDKPLMAAAIGFISTISYEISTQILLHFGVGKYSLYQLNSFIITINRPNIIIGLIVSFGIGCLAGILFYYIAQKLGTDYITIKALIFSILVWLTLELVFTALVEGKTIDIRPISDYFNKFYGTIAFGITLGLLFKRFLLKKLVSNISS